MRQCIKSGIMLIMTIVLFSSCFSMVETEDANQVAVEASARLIAIKDAYEKPSTKNEFDLFIIHTGDVKGQIEEGIGIGYAKFATLVNAGRSMVKHTLLLDAGNVISGSDLTDKFQGETAAVLLNLLDYDAVALGPMDLNHGTERLMEIAAISEKYSEMDMLSTMLLDTKGEQVFKGYELFDYDGFSVGVIGMTAPVEINDLNYLSNSVMANVQATIDTVASQTDFVVVLGSLGTVEGVNAEYLAEKLKGIDLIIEGSRYKTPPSGTRIGDTLIVSVAEALANVGLVQIHVIEGEADEVWATRINASDVKNPGNSLLMKAFGATYIMDDRITKDYIDSQKVALDIIQKNEEALRRAVNKSRKTKY